jgi:RHS repeat-associated protein
MSVKKSAVFVFVLCLNLLASQSAMAWLPNTWSPYDVGTYQEVFNIQCRGYIEGYESFSNPRGGNYITYGPLGSAGFNMDHPDGNGVHGSCFYDMYVPSTGETVTVEKAGLFSATYHGDAEHFVTENEERPEEETPENTETCGGNPIDISNGCKIQIDTDIKSTEKGRISFSRYYNAKALAPTPLGNKWLHKYYRNVEKEKALPGKLYNATNTRNSSKYATPQAACEQGWAQVKKLDTRTAVYEDRQCYLYNDDGKRTSILNTYNTFFAANIKQVGESRLVSYLMTRPNGEVVQLYQDRGIWNPTGSQKVSLKTVQTGIEYTDENASIEYYDSLNRLYKIKHLGGRTELLSYNNANQLISVVDDWGDELNFAYNTSGNLLSVTAPGNRVTAYRYNTNNMLEHVDKPDGTTRRYHYENTSYPTALTGITDERGIRYASWFYDAQGRAISSEHANGAERIDIEYVIPLLNDVSGIEQRILTNSKGQTTTYKFKTQHSQKLVTEISGAGCKTCQGGTTVYEYDTLNRLIAKTVNGVKTTYTNFDNKNNPRFIFKGVGSGYQKDIYPSYDTRFNHILSGISTSSVYHPYGSNSISNYRDASGKVYQSNRLGYTPAGLSNYQSTYYKYLGPLNQLSQINGPRTDVLDITNLAYYADDATQGHNRARLKSITRANLTTRDNIQYTPTGKIKSEQRLNGLTLAYTYYPGNDRLQTLSQSDGSTTRTTRWTYLATGEVKSITLGHGTTDTTTVTFAYDDARRLTRITDGLGNYIEYTLDTESNRTDENIYDQTGTLQRSLNQTYDIYSKLDTNTQANEITDYDFASDGMLTSKVDGNNVTASYDYDAIKRLTTITNDVGGLDASTKDTQTIIGYDVHDHATSITDPNNATTTRGYDDFGNLVSRTSPDTGTTTYTYDLADNRISQTDANGITLNYSYDALNRLISIIAPETSNNVSYIYDTCTNGLGRLCSMTKNDIVTTYAYNTFGDVTQHQTQTYTHDTLGRIKTITFDNGDSLTYQYNLADQTSNIELNHGGSTTTIVSNITYQPFGEMISLTYGNGLLLNQSYDSAYRLTNKNISGTYQQSYDSYDGNGNIKTINDALTLQSNVFDYDNLNRLTSANTTGYQYDRNGNRIGLTTVTKDAIGNILNDGKNIYTYDQHHRLITVDNNISYQYNALGQRKSKTVDGITTNYFYNLTGQLVSEQDSTGTTLAEYVYLNQQPIAVIKQGEVYYIHTDHLDTPRVITDTSQTIVWRWTSEAFGATLANEDVDGDGMPFAFNLRFAGQYFDKETKLHYNYFRYYDPSTGRYITSDPIGLNGGLNTYAYVGGNPLVKRGRRE